MREGPSGFTWKWLLGIIGLAAGGSLGVAGLIHAYDQVPGTPGGWELIVQVVIVAVASLVAGILGFAIGWGIDLLTMKGSD